MIKKHPTLNLLISDGGLVQSLHKSSPHYKTQTEGFLDKDGYRKYRHWMIHRLVLETFVGSCPDGMQACHNDNNRSNNNVANLRWDTPKNNMQDSVQRNSLWHKLTKKQVQEIKLSKLSSCKLSKIYNVSSVHIWMIKVGKRRLT